MRKFNVGDRVRVIKSANTSRIGAETVVLQIIKPGAPGYLWTDESIGYVVDLPSIHPGHEHRKAWYTPDALAPIYDGDEPAKWEDCVWKPTQVKA